MCSCRNKSNFSLHWDREQRLFLQSFHVKSSVQRYREVLLPPPKKQGKQTGWVLKTQHHSNTWFCFYQRMAIKSRQSLHASMLKCLEPALALIASRWRLLLLHNEVCLYINLWEKDPTYHLIYDLMKHFIYKRVVSCVSFLSYGIKRDAHFVYYCFIRFKMQGVL